jgi:hypothetical protein
MLADAARAEQKWTLIPEALLPTTRLRPDATLRARYRAVRGENYDGLRELLNLLVESGVVARVDEATLTRLADLCWLISEFWLPSVEISGSETDDAQTQQGIDLMWQVLRPYLTG